MLQGKLDIRVELANNRAVLAIGVYANGCDPANYSTPPAMNLSDFLC